MPEPARHMAADRASDNDKDEKAWEQMRKEMGKDCQKQMNTRHETFAAMQPLFVLNKFNNHQTTPTEDGEVMPGNELGRSEKKVATASENASDRQMGSAQ